MSSHSMSERELEQIYDLLVHIQVQPPSEINREELRLQTERLRERLYGGGSVSLPPGHFKRVG
jgi:hypothetical protein